jgi:hypothetical protein
MDRLLSLSQAARMVGVPRKILQQQIQEGQLATFEGHIRLSELLKAYPAAEPERSGMVEKVRRIRDSALAGAGPQGPRDAASLRAEVQRLRVDLSLALDQVASYRQLAAETQERLLDLQERCDRRQAMLLGTLIGWFMHQVKLRDAD